MNIVLVIGSVIPVTAYGGTQRVIWYLGKELVKLGHCVTFLAGRGSTCDFARAFGFFRAQGRLAVSGFGGRLAPCVAFQG